MIELVAHNDNCWPGAFRLHMKDTGFLLGIGRDVVAIARMRLDEEGIDGPLRITFAASGQVITQKAAKSETVADWMPEFRASVDALLAAPAVFENPFATGMSETFPPSAVPAEKETTAKRTATQLPSSPNRGFAPAPKKPAAKKKAKAK
jgi:hypothetical protein